MAAISPVITTPATTAAPPAASAGSSPVPAAGPASLRGICPEPPVWIPKEKWEVLNQYVKHDLREAFPCFMCRTFSLKLGFALMAIYNGRTSSGFLGDFTCQIDGKEAALSFVHYYPWTMEHCFLKLRIADEEWIIDSTWKQFAYKRNKDGLGYDPNDPYNRRLIEECPDILIAKRADFERVFRDLAKHLESQGELEAAERVLVTCDWWKGDSSASDFSSLVKAIVDPVFKASLGYSVIPCYERDVQKGWEFLQSRIGMPLDSVRRCAEKAIGLVDESVSVDDQKGAAAAPDA